ncbi:MAG TPA: DUF3108 domain-containing protein [Thermoanaerobaculia bacterium]
MLFGAALLLAPALSLSEPVAQAFTEGETLDYTVQWMKITGGTARTTIAPSGDDMYRITSVAKSSGGFSRLVKVRDEIETFVAKSDFSTLRYVKRLDEKGDKMEEVTTVEEGVATRKRKKIKKVPVPRPVYDPFSVIYYMRTLDLTPGKTYDFTLISDGKVYTVHAKVLRREKVQTHVGAYDTVVVEPRMTSSGVEREEKLHVWYSEDERHIPVRIRTEVKFGSVTATLRGIQSGVTSIDPPLLSK